MELTTQPPVPRPSPPPRAFPTAPTLNLRVTRRRLILHSFLRDRLPPGFRGHWPLVGVRGCGVWDMMPRILGSGCYVLKGKGPESWRRWLMEWVVWYFKAKHSPGEYCKPPNPRIMNTGDGPALSLRCTRPHPTTGGGSSPVSTWEPESSFFPPAPGPSPPPTSLW